MRILHAIHSVDVRGGGPIEGIKQLALHNTGAGHTVEVVSLDAPDHPGLKDFPVRAHGLGPSYLGYGYAPRFVPWLMKHQPDYDVVIVNGIWQYNSLGVWYALNRAVTPYCVFPHGMLDPWFKQTYPLKHLKKWLYWPWGDFRVLRDALAVFFTTDEERRLARRSFWLYRCDEIVLPYGINPPTGDAVTQRKGFLDRFPHLRGKRLLLYLSRIHEKKGCDLLIEAFAKLLREGGGRADDGSQMSDVGGLMSDSSISDLGSPISDLPSSFSALSSPAAHRLPPTAHCLPITDLRSPSPAPQPLHLVISGNTEDPYARRLQKRVEELGISEHVTWTGLVTGDLKWGALHAAEAFVLPSHQENFGIAVAEALACGLPVLISNKVNIWREIRTHHAGLVELDTLEGAERLLRDWLALNPEEKDAMRRRARHCFDQCFDAIRFGETFIKTLRLLGLRE